MSNRLRILFHCDLDGHVAFTGSQAIRRMQFLSNAPILPPHMLVSKTTWVNMGRPAILEKQVAWAPEALSPDFLYLVKSPAQASQPLEMDSTRPLDVSLSTAKMLWKRLPPEIRKLSSLMVLRENRANCWRRSQANPRKHGWVVQKASQKTSQKTELQAQKTKKSSALKSALKWAGVGATYWGALKQPNLSSLGSPLDVVEGAPPVPSVPAGYKTHISHSSPFDVAETPQEAFQDAFPAPLSRSKKPKAPKASVAVQGQASSQASTKTLPPKAQLRLGIWS